ncbi:nuclease-related domain-containing protein [Microbacterium sp.]|uniref:nuclease-related domain-containing protein n=1 Tax=Microbacterium sp. TaxID=51671 RepID=UPI0025D0CC2A|nr:nuclease-related domain-containing protein [Microbacterium sp.]
MEIGPDDKQMSLRYAGTCRLCHEPLPAGRKAIYERRTRTVRCIECRPADAAPIEHGEPAAAQVESGVAGASARREHERRSAAREARIRADHPKLGGLILALSEDPQSTRAWERGATGEEMMAKRLTDLPDSWRVLHDRRIPGSRANIDHIAVGPTGVWVIDAKRYKDKRPSLHVEGGIIRPRVESLLIAGRNHTKLADGVQGQVEKVSSALGNPEIAVKGVLCFLDADWPLIGGSFAVNGVDVLWPKLLIKRMTEAPAVAIDVAEVHARLGTHFPPA